MAEPDAEEFCWEWSGKAQSF